jgi:hypothetical protein
VILAGAGAVLFVRNPAIQIFERREYSVELPGCKGVTLNQSSWRSPFTLYVNGVPAAAGDGKRSFRIPRDDGTETQVQLLWTFFDVPRLRAGNDALRAVPPLDGLQWGIIILPLVLVFIGGALGGAAGGAGAMINARILRSDGPKNLRLLLAAGATILSAVCYLIGLLLFLKLFGK